MRKFLVILAMLLLSITVYAQNTDYTFNPNLSTVKYGVGFWSESSHGNHRAVVSVDSASSAVLANVEWRRRDINPEEKAIIVENSKGVVVNSKAFNINKISGDVVFEAKEAGTYYIYYMPYTPSGAYSIDVSEYFSNVCNADKTWLANNKLDGDTYSTNLPKAKLVSIESRSEYNPKESLFINWKTNYSRDDFNSMYPMEVSISDKELSEFNNKYANRPFLLFCEDRLNPIKMLNEIPYKWYKSGEVTSFTGKANPNEIYTFQIGIDAKEDLKNLKLNISDLKGNKTIPASAIHCINTGGVDYLGKPFTKIVNVNKGRVQPLWFYVQMPKDAQGSFKGTVGVSFNNAPETVASINIDVDGKVLEDGGVSDLWRMSRLSWLNSSLGIDNKIIPPYTPVKVLGDTVSILNRSITFDSIGFPKGIKSNGQKVIISPVDFGVYVSGKKLDFKVKSKKVIEKNEGAYEFSVTSSNDSLELTVSPRIEFDGSVEYKVKLKALKNIDLSDVTLNIPMNINVAKYAMGLGIRGGKAPLAWDWQWNASKVDYMVWLGNYNAGMQLKLNTVGNIYKLAGAFDESVLPPGWYNNNLGGMKLKKEDKSYSINAFSGAKSIKAGESVDYDFRLMITPFKSADTNRYNYRVGDISAPYTNSKLIFHATPGNAFINYPFLESDKLKSIVDSVQNMEVSEPYRLTYKMDGVNSKEGAVTLWIENNFDWSSTPTQRQFLDINFGNERLGIYWCTDTKTIRLYSFKRDSNGVTFKLVQDTTIPPSSWKVGEKHVVTVSWGKTTKVYCDGALVDEVLLTPTTTDLNCDNITVYNEFNYDAIRVDNKDINNVEKKSLDSTVLFDDLNKQDKNGNFVPEVSKNLGMISGSYSVKDGMLTSGFKVKKNWAVDIYYTARELSNHAYEIWALRSLGDEIYDNKGMVYTAEGAKVLTKTGGGYQWLNEHLLTDYIPSWHMRLSEGEHCASISTKYESRWLNYYVVGMDFLMKDIGISGLYLDGIGYNREISKRISKVMYANNPNYTIDYHSGNNYDYLNWKANVMNTTIEHLPFMTNLWIGEMFDYNREPNYWFTEISGIPFGVPSEMLEYNDGGNPYRGMLYGMTGRLAPSYNTMLRFWDTWGIKKSESIGYWDNKPLATTDNPDILTTVYKKKDKVLIAVGSWVPKDTTINITLDYKALGFDKNKVTIRTPQIDDFQDEQTYTSLDNILVKASKGMIIEVSKL